MVQGCAPRRSSLPGLTGDCFQTILAAAEDAQGRAMLPSATRSRDGAEPDGRARPVGQRSNKGKGRRGRMSSRLQVIGKRVRSSLCRQSQEAFELGENATCAVQGRCIHHPQVRMRRRKLFDGWQALITACPNCCIADKTSPARQTRRRWVGGGERVSMPGGRRVASEERPVAPILSALSILQPE